MNRLVDQYIESLPEGKQKLCEYIRQLIIENVDGVEERFSYKLPVYHYFGMFMFMNNTKEGIDIGFMRGKDLLEAFPQLERKDRAIIASVCIKSKKDIATYDVSQMIISAAAWNQEAKQLKIPMVKKKQNR
ncbi:MAG: DUF1801 domain-containing protein [Chitinophagaceae bacterium]